MSASESQSTSDRHAVAPTELEEQAIRGLTAAYQRMRQEIGKVIIGQDEVVDQLLIAMFCRGHCLLVGVPGLAKTLLCSTIAGILQLAFRRIQFTPDLMPSDMTGTDVLQDDPETGRRVFQFIQGPLFTNVLLADEINRTPPKTQAALLEAMQERQITVGSNTYDLPEPFFTLATQNPIEQEGTYPLPEAQLDRFMFNVVVSYPTAAEELRILKQTTGNEKPQLTPVLTGRQIQALQEVVRRVPCAEYIFIYARDLVRATRPGEPEAIPPQPPPNREESHETPHVPEHHGLSPEPAGAVVTLLHVEPELRRRLHVGVGGVERYVEQAPGRDFRGGAPNRAPDVPRVMEHAPGVHEGRLGHSIPHERLVEH